MSQINVYPDVEEDIWELRSTGSDSACINGVFVNGKLIEEKTNWHNVWVGGASNQCYALLEVTKSLKWQ